MDIILEKADEYVFDSFYRVLPAIPVPDLIAGLAAIPSFTESYSLLTNSSTAPLDTLKSIASNVYSATTTAGLTLNTLEQDNVIRQTLSLFCLTLLGAFLMYFTFASTSYFLVFDQNHTKHPKYLKNQVKLEIQMSVKALPGIAVLTTPWFLGEVRGWSQLYSHIHNVDAILEKTAAAVNPPSSLIQETFAAAIATGTSLNSTAVNAAAHATAAAEHAAQVAKFGPLGPLVSPFLDGWGFVFISCVAFLLFTDFGIYWVHRLLHHPLVYKRLHKPHHKWIIPTPYSSHAFHFLDGYLQSVPYHVFVFICPMHKYIYLGMFGAVNLWSVLIHDGEYKLDSALVNSAAHHAVHHLYFNYNYGQYFTMWDRIGGSYRKPKYEEHFETKKNKAETWKKQAKEVDNFDENGKPTAASDESFKTKPTKKAL
ncbi:c-5 sterol desaturase [Linnemannia exigua]|uniref:C-5 sterol desaturase n=1 Tax=Linnemannia exigua TaxID=604196 RepID=A0AAD4DLR5_9FUNG|nr:c-5 sterol desaturase [Linnemannia exigua]